MIFLGKVNRMLLHMPIKNQLNQSALVKVYRATTVMNGHFGPKQALFEDNNTRTKFE